MRKQESTHILLEGVFQWLVCNIELTKDNLLEFFFIVLTDINNLLDVVVGMKCQ